MWLTLLLLFALAAAVAAVITVVGWQRRDRAPAMTVVAFWAGCIVVWAGGDLALLLARTETEAFLACCVLFLGLCANNAAFFCMCATSADRAWRLSRRLALVLAVEPALVMLALATNAWHHRFIRGFEVGIQDTLVPVFGFLFWMHVAYIYAVVAAGLVRVGRAWLGAPPGRRWVYGWVPLVIVPPIVTNLIGLSLAGHTVDLTVTGHSIGLIVTYLVFVRQSLPELVPVARRRVFDTISDAVAVVDRAGRLLDVNPAGERLLRQLCDDLPDTLVGTSPVPLEMLALPEQGEADQVLLDANGSGVDVHVRTSSVLDRHDRCTGWVLVARDVTETHQQHRELEKANARLQDQLHTIEALRADLAEQAVRDVLTGLHNRRYLLDVLDREIHEAVRAGSPLSVAIVDIDHFKAINDRHGHGVGDAVLVHVGRLLRDEVRQTDVVARYGGEEFVLLLPGFDTDQAWRRLEALREQLGSAALPIGGCAVNVTFSAGVAALNGSEDPDELIAAADRALYEAKRRGRNRVMLS
jgi:diguanylate cyclase (GGDEF)-like protein